MLGEEFHDERGKGRGDIGVERDRLHGILIEHLGDQRHRRPRLEWELARETFVHDDAHGVQIRPRVDRLAEQLLG